MPMNVRHNCYMLDTQKMSLRSREKQKLQSTSSAGIFRSKDRREKTHNKMIT
jgi:hypothetical protein